MHSSIKLLIAGLIGLCVLLVYGQWTSGAQQPRPDQNPPPQGQAPPAQPGPGAQSNSNLPAPPPLTQMQAQLLSTIHQTNQLEIEAGRMARSKSDSFEVREYGDRLALDHMAADRIIRRYAQQHDIPLTGVQEMQETQQNAPAMQQMQQAAQQIQQSAQQVRQNLPQTPDAQNMQRSLQQMQQDAQQIQQNMPNIQQNAPQMQQRMQQMQQAMQQMQQNLPQIHNLQNRPQVQQSLNQMQQSVQQLQQDVPQMSNTPAMQARQTMQKATTAVQQLQSLQGKEFDQQFLQLMQQGHQEAISMLAKAHDQMPKSQLQSALNKLIPILVQHYQIASTLNIRQAAKGLGGL
ncbi:MAG TPA: DUF4142 domain-containing protein [Terriglobia bacterium]|nr:DUF4142 domain-containing protein [Terriglobia bacterium]